ncbi:MAG: hypothetical protein DWQ07_14090 [Chloroflexi bacterium]|nr:MAG: hypothetical protein DWQ07_14090 [Chloroflexota bacterium]
MASYYHELLDRESDQLERSKKRLKERRRKQMLDDLELDEVQFRELKELLAKRQRLPGGTAARPPSPPPA